MTPTERLYDGAKAALESTVDRLVTTFHRGKIESPIEELLLKALLAYQIVPSTGTDISIVSQETILLPDKPVRVDFLVKDHDYGVKCVVEADGHDFHERTKEQAQRDRKRDRDLQSAGYLVLRFTGSEIYRDPWRCAEQVFANIRKAAGSRT